MTKNPLPKLMSQNSIGIQIEGSDAEFRLNDIAVWPNRGEFKRVGQVRKFFLYNGDTVLLESAYAYQGTLPDVFGLVFKRVVSTHVDLKFKTQNITAIFKTYDILNAVEDMHEMTGYDS